MGSFAQKIDDIIAAGWRINDREAYRNWSNRVSAFLQSAIDENSAETFKLLVGEDSYWVWAESREKQIGHLEGLALRVESKGLSTVTASQENRLNVNHLKSSKVFIVHGHDNEIKETVARFIEMLGLKPIILHEQPNSGRTIIEKFEIFSDVGFAVVLLTPDDVGGVNAKKVCLNGRARQNVILELGYFTGKLGRQRVCPLYKRGVEIPSDFQGVLYTEIDNAGGWKTKLAQELVEVGFSIDLAALLKR